MLKLLAGKTFEYPIYLDVEDDSQKPLPYGTLMDMCYAYCELLVENGYYPGIYSYRNFINSYMDPEQLSARFEVWTAHYLNEDDDYYADEYNMWQYTDVGRVDGVVGDVDMNICYKDYPSIIKKYGYNGYSG
jgi:GH25 family lysozyme M1 (1,4-beta-N-acetylmuramidase)